MRIARPKQAKFVGIKLEDGWWGCPHSTCDKKYPTLRGAHIHYGHSHGKARRDQKRHSSRYVCEFCQRVFPKRQGRSIHIARMHKEEDMLNQDHGDMQPPPSPEVPDSPESPLVEMGGAFEFPSPPPPESPLVRLGEVLSSPSPDVDVIESMPSGSCDRRGKRNSVSAFGSDASDDDNRRRKSKRSGNGSFGESSMNLRSQPKHSIYYGSAGLTFPKHVPLPRKQQIKLELEQRQKHAEEIANGLVPSRRILRLSNQSNSSVIFDSSQKSSSARSSLISNTEQQ